MLSKIPAINQGQLTLGNLQGSALPLAIIETAQKFDGLSVLICADTAAAIKFESELTYLAQDYSLDVLLFPDWETLPYDNFSPHQDIISQRLETLYRLPTMKKGILILPVATAMTRVVPPSFLAANSLLLAQDEISEPATLKKQTITDVSTTIGLGGKHKSMGVLKHELERLRGQLLLLLHHLVHVRRPRRLLVREP